MASGFSGAGTPSAAAAPSGQSREAAVSAPKMNVFSKFLRNGSELSVNDPVDLDHGRQAPNTRATNIFFLLLGFCEVFFNGHPDFLELIFSKKIGKKGHQQVSVVRICNFFIFFLTDNPVVKVPEVRGSR
jgi:hypothetical protein